MTTLDKERLAYSLAGAMLAGEWSVKGVGLSLWRMEEMHALRLKGLARGIVKAFGERPGFYELVDLLRGHGGLSRALKRGGVRRVGMAREREMRDALGIGLPEIATVGALAEWLGISLGRLGWMADVTGRNRRLDEGLWAYRYRWIAKRTGKPRLLEMPVGSLKALQRTILREILDVVPVHAAAHGFTAGRSITTNAAPHCGKEVVLRLDLEDFFASVTAARVFRIFRTLGYPSHVARVLMGLCTTAAPAAVWGGAAGREAGRGLSAGAAIHDAPPAAGRADVPGAGEPGGGAVGPAVDGFGTDAGSDVHTVCG